MSFANRILTIPPSATLKAKQKALDLARRGIKVINLSAGEPAFPTPEKIREACKKAIDENWSYYGPVNGLPELREAIAKKLKRDLGVEAPPDAIVVTCGAKQAIYSALQVLINPGEEVLLPTPYWVSYPSQIQLAGGKPIFLPTDETKNFKIDAAQLKKALTKKTKLLILNTPSNPTGVCYSGEELEAIGKVCAEKKIWVLSDEIYEPLTFDGFRHTSFLKAAPFHREKTILVHGASKAFAMTGWRMGFVLGPAPFIDKFKILQGQEITSIPTFIQRAGISAYNDCDGEVERMRQEYEKRRNISYEAILKIPKIRCIKPQGSFYIFPDVSAYGKSSLELEEILLEKAHVSVIAGDGFGAPGHLRISFVAKEEQIREGISRIQKALKDL